MEKNAKEAVYDKTDKLTRSPAKTDQTGYLFSLISLFWAQWVAQAQRL